MTEKDNEAMWGVSLKVVDVVSTANTPSVPEYLDTAMFRSRVLQSKIIASNEEAVLILPAYQPKKRVLTDDQKAKLAENAAKRAARLKDAKTTTAPSL